LFTSAGESADKAVKAAEGAKEKAQKEAAKANQAVADALKAASEAEARSASAVTKAAASEPPADQKAKKVQPAVSAVNRSRRPSGGIDVPTTIMLLAAELDSLRDQLQKAEAGWMAATAKVRIYVWDTSVRQAHASTQHFKCWVVTRSQEVVMLVNMEHAVLHNVQPDLSLLS
jgi:hypothetical protein